MLAEMVVGLGVDASKLASGLSGAEKSVGGFAGKAKAVGAGMAKTGAAMSLGITAPLAMMAKIGIGELGDIEAANTQTAAAIGRIGAKSLVSVGGVQKLAGALQAKSGIDDQVIQSGQNMLLTLGNLDTKTAQGAKTFALASTAMVDFAEATGTDAAGAGKLFAKSLAAAGNGALLLPKGVKLSATETAKLTKVLESGASAGTKQAAVAEALGQKFAGSAKLTSTEKWAVMQDQFAGIAASLVEQLMPAISGLTTWLGKVMDKFDALSPGQKKFVAFGALAVAAIGPVIGIVGMLAMAFGGLAAASTALGVSMMTILIVPIAIIAAIALLIAAGVLLYKNWDEIKAKVVEIWGSIKDAAVSAFTALGAWLSGLWDSIKATATSAWTAIKTWLSTAADAVADTIKTGINKAVGFLSAIWTFISTGITNAWNAYKTLVVTLATAVVSAITNTIDNVVGGITAIWTTVRTGITTAWNLVKTAATTAATAVVTAIKDTIDNVIDKVSAVWTSVKGGIVTAWTAIKETAKTQPGNVIDGLEAIFLTLPTKLLDIGKDAGGKLASGIKTAVNAIIGKWNDLSFGGFSVGKGKMKVTVPEVSTPNIPLFAKGGVVSGPTLGLMGEYAGARNNPEVVAPLDRLLGIMQNAMGGGGSGGVTIHINGPISSERDARMYGQAIVRELRLQGVRP